MTVSGGSYPTVEGVSCPASGECLAVGSGQDTNYYPVPFTATLSGGSWTVAKATDPSFATAGADLSGVSCIPDTAPTTWATDCWIGGTGDYNYDSTTEEYDTTAFAEHPGASASAYTSLLPGGASDSDLAALSCPTTTSCAAIGDYYVGGTTEHFLADTLSGGTWAASPAFDIASHSGYFGDISCGGSTGACFADGSADGGNAMLVATDVGSQSAPTTPSITNLPSAPAYGDQFTANVSTTGDGTKSVTSSTTGVCTVGNDGLTVSFVGVGECDLTAHVGAGSSYLAADGNKQSVTVRKAAPSAPSISNLPASATYGDHFTATVATTGDGTKSVTSSTGSVCTVGNDGLTVSFVGAGECDLTAHVAAGSHYSARDGSQQSVTAGKAAPSAPSITNLPASPVYGDQFTATVDTTGDGTRSVTSATTTVCTVGNDGLTVSFVGVGDCDLTAHVGTGSDYSAGDGTTQTVTAGQATPSDPVISNLPGSPSYGDQFTADVATTGDGTTSVTSSTPSTCSVGNDGLTVSFVGVGDCLLTAHVGDGTNFTAREGSEQTTTAAQATPSEPSITNLPASPSYGDQFTATVDTTGDGSTSVTSSTSGVCTVGNDGLTVSFVGVGECDLTAHAAEGTDYAAGDGKQQAVQSGRYADTERLVPTTGEIGFGTSETLTETISSVSLADPPTGTVTVVLTPSDAPVSPTCTDIPVTVVDGVATAECSTSDLPAGTDDLQADFTSTNANYQAQATGATAQVIVDKATTLVTPEQPAAVIYGSTPTVTVDITPATLPGSVQFSVDGKDIGSAVSVANGSATSPALTNADSTPLDAGDHAVDAVFTPTDDADYTGDEQSTKVTVDPAGTSTALTVTASKLTATVSTTAPGAGDPTGSVTFTVDGSPVGTASLQSGVASLNYTVASGKTHQVGAEYSGATDFIASSASTAREDPTITATVHSSRPKSSFGWYRTPVRVSFHCTTHGSSLASPCPAQVILRRNGGGQSLSRTIRQVNGGAATVAVGPIDIDRTVPVVRITGARNGAVYDGPAPAFRCVAHDALSGVARCSITKHTTDTGVTRYKVVAVDRAGNRRTVRGHFRSLQLFMPGVRYVNGAFVVHRGTDYVVSIYARSRPRYYYAEPATSGRPRPFRPGPFMTPAGHDLWTVPITITRRMKHYRYWNIGAKVGKRLLILRLDVRP